jgi:hypothetical protein
MGVGMVAEIGIRKRMVAVTVAEIGIRKKMELLKEEPKY